MIGLDGGLVNQNIEASSRYPYLAEVERLYNLLISLSWIKLENYRQKDDTINISVQIEFNYKEKNKSNIVFFFLFWISTWK